MIKMMFGLKICSFLLIIILLLPSCMAVKPLSNTDGMNKPTEYPIIETLQTPSNEPKQIASETIVPTEMGINQEDLKLEIVGFGTHGAMFEITYSSGIAELVRMDVEIETMQGGIDKEKQAFEVEGDKYLAEMTDAMYSIGPIDVKLVFHHPESTILTTVKNNNIIPWMVYFYNESILSSRLSYPWDPAGHDAWDLQPISLEYPDGDGHPVLSPCNGIVFRSEVIPETVDTSNLYIYCLETGYFVQLGHMNNLVSVNDSVTPETIVGNLHWEKNISRPHNHTKIVKPRYFPVKINDSIESGALLIDIFNPQNQLGGLPAQYGFWLSDTLPQGVKEMIDDGLFLSP